MEPMFSNGMCRCCASEGTYKDLSSKYRWMGVDEVYADMLRECFDVTLVTPEDSTEGGICEVCITQLRNAANFKKQVLNTEEQFKRVLQNKPYKSDIVKVEVSPPDDELRLTDEDNNLSNDDFSSTEYEVPIKTESSEEGGKSRKRSAKAGPSRSKHAKLEGETSSKRPLKPRKKILSIVPRVDVRLTRRKEVHKHQENIAAILTWSNATPLRCRGRLYACSFCSREFQEPADLKRHTTSCHDDEKPGYMKGHSLASFIVKLDVTNLTCKVCQQAIPSLTDLTSHLVSHGIPFHTKIKNQIVPFNFDSDVLKCAICRHEFNNFKVLLEHMNRHYSNYVCSICGSGFVNTRILQAHSYRHIKGEFRCSQCSKVFDTKVKMKDHERAVHICQNKRNKCGYCGEMFSDYTKRNEHEVSAHGAKAVELACQACDKSFRSQRALTVHVKLFHMLEGRTKRTENS